MGGSLKSVLSEVERAQLGDGPWPDQTMKLAYVAFLLHIPHPAQLRIFHLPTPAFTL
jgi:hypothetical protein